MTLLHGVTKEIHNYSAKHYVNSTMKAL